MLGQSWVCALQVGFGFGSLQTAETDPLPGQAGEKLVKAGGSPQPLVRRWGRAESAPVGWVSARQRSRYESLGVALAQPDLLHASTR